jgi:cold shock CspA family protein
VRPRELSSLILLASSGVVREVEPRSGAGAAVLSNWNGIMFVTGTVKHVRLDKGFCFIATPGMAKDVFCHFYDLADEIDVDESLQERCLEFEIQQSDKGPRAVNVRSAK